MNFLTYFLNSSTLLRALVFLLGSSIANAQIAYNPAGPLLIRPFGDSITFGIGFLGPADAQHPDRGWYCPVYWPEKVFCQWPLAYGGGYRGWMTLFAIQTRQIVFTTEGYQSNGSYWQQWLTNSHLHDGYPGARTDQLVVAANLASASDVTLVHAGTNDIFQGINGMKVPGAPALPSDPIELASFTFKSLVTLINTLLDHNPKTHILVAQIIPFAPPVSAGILTKLNTTVTAYNQLIGTQLINGLPITAQPRVHIVDMGAILDPVNDYFDGVHPNFMGYQKMACVWIKEIQQSQNPCPVGTLQNILDEMKIPPGAPPMPDPGTLPPGFFPIGLPTGQ